MSHWCIMAYYAACNDFMVYAREMLTIDPSRRPLPQDRDSFIAAGWAEKRVMACEECRPVLEEMKKESAR